MERIEELVQFGKDEEGNSDLIPEEKYSLIGKSEGNQMMFATSADESRISYFADSPLNYQYVDDSTIQDLIKK